nr:putative nuclease HARBI1 isoform X1 [Tanacetum cinerariifolium]
MYKLYYDPLFRDTVVVGYRSKLPLDCRLVDEDEEHQEGKGDSDDMNDCDDEEPLFPESSLSKRKMSSGSGCSTKGKTSVTSFDEKLDSVINALSSKSIQSLPPHNLIPLTQDYKNIVTRFLGFEKGTNQYFEALKIFFEEGSSRNFMVPTNNKTEWEGTAHDTRIFNEALRRPEVKFPIRIGEKYYVFDAGYPNTRGYLASYKGIDIRYHLRDIRRG